MIRALKRGALSLLMMAVTVAIVAPAQSAPNWPWLQGCQVTFVLRTSTTPVVQTAVLTIDAAWLEYSMVPDALRHACPSQPVEATNVWLSSAILDLFKIKDLGQRRSHPDWSLDIFASAMHSDWPGTQSAPADRVHGQPVETTIAMQKTGRGRLYDIEYLSPDVTMAGQVRIWCGDDPVNRTCRRWGYPPFAGLMVNYRISQDQFPAPNEASTDPNTESGAVLQFDRRLREWLIDLERPH